jgi:KDO2-lipid IV(A) lauroyltransferase
MPLDAGLWVGRRLGDLMRILAGKRYHVALKNLRIAYGSQLTRSERERIAKECFQHFGMMAIESVKFSTLPPEEVFRRIDVDPEYRRRVEELFDSRDRGVLFLSGHQGNFEVAGRYWALMGRKVCALARNNRDPRMTALMTSLRNRMGIEVLPISGSLKRIVSALREKAAVAIICDQNASDVYVPFFGQPTGTADGPARIALKFGVPMLFFACIRTGRGRYRVIDGGIYTPENTGDEAADIAAATTELNRRLEMLIRMHPEQWLWFHDRWRASPDVHDPGEAALTPAR